MPPGPTPPETSQRVDFLDSMRGFAILAVFGFHCLRASNHHENLFPWNGLIADFWNEPLYKLGLVPLNLGACGVAIFFVISGFCIHVSHSRRPDPWFKSFFTKRVLRIYPPYLMPLLLFAFVYPFGATDLSTPKESLSFFAHLFLVHNFFDLEVFSGINPSFWSIAVEAQLYVIYPLMFLLARWKGWRTTLLVCSAIEVPIRFIAAAAITDGASLDRAITSSPLAYVFSWGIGAAIADAYLRRERLPLANQSFWLWFGLSVIAPHVLPLTSFTFLIHAVATGVFVSRTLNGERFVPSFPGSKFVSRHLAFVGMVSYSFYLIHQPIVNRIEPLVERILGSGVELPRLVTLLLCLATWPIMVGLAWLMYRCVEMPSIALARLALSTSNKSPRKREVRLPREQEVASL